jgi:hypothetical protein
MQRDAADAGTFVAFVRAMHFKQPALAATSPRKPDDYGANRALRAVAASLAAFAVTLSTSESRAAPAVAAEVEAEAAVVATSRNDVRIPGDSGTRFSLVDDLQTSAAPAFRIRVGARLYERHLITLLYAPLETMSSGRVARELTFSGVTFPAQTPLWATYRFDSYRLTYRYSFIRHEELELAAGLTAKIRDAEISLHGPETARKTNTGFVPLLNLHAEWRPGGGAFGVLFDADALAAPQGRAEDVLLAVQVRPRERITVYAGYRTLEGGADNDEVFNFSWLHYAALGLRVEL